MEFQFLYFLLQGWLNWPDTCWSASITTTSAFNGRMLRILVEGLPFSAVVRLPHMKATLPLILWLLSRYSFDIFSLFFMIWVTGALCLSLPVSYIKFYWRCLQARLPSSGISGRAFHFSCDNIADLLSYSIHYIRRKTDFSFWFSWYVVPSWLYHIRAATRRLSLW